MDEDKKESQRMTNEFWDRSYNQILCPNGEVCPEKGNCERYKEIEDEGLSILLCEPQPSTCKLNPFELNREYEEL